VGPLYKFLTRIKEGGEEPVKALRRNKKKKKGGKGWTFFPRTEGGGFKKSEIMQERRGIRANRRRDRV